MRLCLDPGHGGADPGAVGPDKNMESKIVLKVCHSLRVALEQLGHDVFMTRACDKEVSLKERSEMGNLCDFFVSVHCNAFADPSVSGVETIYSSINDKSKYLAECLQEAVLSSVFDVRSKDRGIKLSPSSSYARTLYVLQNVKKPSALVELEFISNPAWEKIIVSNTLLYASLLCKGIQKYIKSTLPS